MEPTENPTEAYGGDAILYFGPIGRDGYDHVSSILEAKPKKAEKVCITLTTYGGDPDAAYRIARAANHHYKQVEVLIPDVCKSAGTLLCVGAHRLIFGDRGELGPLDIQLSKPDELFESMSGLDIIQALSALQTETLDSFRSYLIDIRQGGGISTKTAADIAVHLAGCLVTPIAEKINPITLGSHLRAMNIATDYGSRLNDMVKSLKPDALNRLVSGYASHRFVIDRKEAKTLFSHVDEPDQATTGLYELARRMLSSLPVNKLVVCDVDDIFKTVKGDAKNKGDVGKCLDKQERKGNDDETNTQPKRQRKGNGSISATAE